MLTVLALCDFHPSNSPQNQICLFEMFFFLTATEQSVGHGGPNASSGVVPCGNASLWEQIVCPPSYKNISYMYRPMLQFVEELEDSEQSPLHNVLTTAVKNFLANVSDELQVI